MVVGDDEMVMMWQVVVSNNAMEMIVIVIAIGVGVAVEIVGAVGRRSCSGTEAR
jgi:hypothetical protein